MNLLIAILPLLLCFLHVTAALPTLIAKEITPSPNGTSLGVGWCGSYIELSEKMPRQANRSATVSLVLTIGLWKQVEDLKWDNDHPISMDHNIEDRPLMLSRVYNGYDAFWVYWTHPDPENPDNECLEFGYWNGTTISRWNDHDKDVGHAGCTHEEWRDSNGTSYRKRGSTCMFKCDAYE